MIVLHPLKGTRHTDTDTFRISTNYKFAELLKKYIEIKGDECMLFGEQEGEILSVEEVSVLAGSFNYEFVCCLGKRIPRVYKGSNLLEK